MRNKIFKIININIWKLLKYNSLYTLNYVSSDNFLQLLFQNINNINYYVV